MINRIGYFFLEFSLLVVQVSAYTSASYGAYLFTAPDNTDSNKRTLTEAVTWCRSNGTKLLEIPNNDVQTTAVQYIQSIYNKDLFNGWTTVVNAKRYNQNWDWVNGQIINNLAVEQQSPDLTKSFGFLQSTGARVLVAAGVATDRKSYICEGSSYCTDGVTFQQRCYKSFSETLSWFDARNKCLDSKSDLASFDFVMNSPGLSVLNGTWLNPTLNYWIGIRRALWRWADSATEVKYTQWVDGHPDFSNNFECVCLYSGNWKWIMCDCGTRYQFICLTAVPSSSSTSTSITSSSTTTTPKVTTKTTTTTTTTTISPMMSMPASATTVNSSITVDYSSSPSLASSSKAAEPDRSPVWSGQSLTYDASLGIGLGVGIGGGLIISAIIVAVYIWARRRGWPGTFPVLMKSQSPDTNHQQAGSSYALIPIKQQPEPRYVDTDIQEGTANIANGDLEQSSSSAEAETSSIENCPTSQTKISPLESTNGEITNGDANRRNSFKV